MHSEHSLLSLGETLFFLNLCGQGMQPFDVPGDAGKVPFPLRLLKTAHRKTSEAHDGLDDAADRFRRCLS